MITFSVSLELTLGIRNVALVLITLAVMSYDVTGATVSTGGAVHINFTLLDLISTAMSSLTGFGGTATAIQ